MDGGLHSLGLGEVVHRLGELSKAPLLSDMSGLVTSCHSRPSSISCGIFPECQLQAVSEPPLLSPHLLVQDTLIQVPRENQVRGGSPFMP